ncbi:uncharacterized protein LOC119689505 [Teleopsis dalmanni]|uniref:uncharacterized protein LOC119689505 n=1 Tax=Teleopsis dalmanni TaxID=139649 RepID=UPI0018CD4E1F|nr:uncharacterized protein LOC119689505 [Teleopsis dalmanni]
MFSRFFSQNILRTPFLSEMLSKISIVAYTRRKNCMFSEIPQLTAKCNMVQSLKPVLKKTVPKFLLTSGSMENFPTGIPQESRNYMRQSRIKNSAARVWKSDYIRVNTKSIGVIEQLNRIEKLPAIFAYLKIPIARAWRMDDMRVMARPLSEYDQTPDVCITLIEKRE